jgi:hypothetical protein
MKKGTPFLIAWILFVTIQACDTKKPLDRQAVLDEMSSREIKRIPETEIFQAAEKMGDSITQQAQATLKKNLMAALEKGGVPHAIQFCNVNATAIMEELQKPKGVTIYRVSDRFRNPDDEPDSLENLIYEAYAYNLNESLPIKPSVIKETEEVLLYTKPIMIAGGLCLNCHGGVGQEISESNYDTILSYYPNDLAINYKLNELRGMWVVRIPRKTIVQSM